MTGAQHGPPAVPLVIADIVDFETSLFTAQLIVPAVGRLDSGGALGGPEELVLREARLQAIGEAKTEIEARAAQRFAGEQADYAAQGEGARSAKSERTGKKPRGAPPAPPTPGPRAQDQINLTLV